MTDNAKIAAYFNIEPIDFATDSGFFVLLDALRAREVYLNYETTNPARPSLTLWTWQNGWPLRVGHSEDINIKTALVAATLEFIERTK